jgi:hypothetical protein
MKLHDYQNCGGPKYCSFCLYILNHETNEEAVDRWQQENRELEEVRMIPDPYKAGIAAMRAASGDEARYAEAHRDDDTTLKAMADFRDRVYEQAMLAALQAPPARGTVYAEPPDGYKIAIERMNTEVER